LATKKMNTQKKILLLLLIGAVLLVFYKQNIFSGLKSETNTSIGETQPQKTLKDAKIIGWTAYWDEKNTLEALPRSIERMSVFTPVLYRIETDGSLEKYRVLYKKEFLQNAKNKNIAIMPQIGDDFDFERVSLLLYDGKIQEKFIESLIEEAKKEGFIGWDIDIESLKTKDRQAFSEFVEETAEALHENNLKFSVTVFARVGNDDNPSALAQDYRALGKVSDEVRIMMYGAHDDETGPGGQAPLTWMRQVLNYAVKNIPGEKIVIGLSTHGYDWDNKKGEPLTFGQIQARIGEATPSVKFDEKVSSAIYRYQKDGQDREIWFENARAITEKMLIAMNEFGTDKFAIWRIGAEDPKIWEELGK